MAQMDLFGKPRRRAPRFGRIFGPRPAGRGHDSKAEARIAGFLAGSGISHRSHCFILPARLRKKAAFSEKEKGEIVRKAAPPTLPPDCLDLVIKRANLAKIRPELFRCDFLVEGTLAGRPRRVFIEYFGLYNPRAKVTPKLLRRRHWRQAAIYTFVKVPLKKAMYEKFGLEAVFISPGELGKAGKLLEDIVKIDQERSTLRAT